MAWFLYDRDIRYEIVKTESMMFSEKGSKLLRLSYFFTTFKTNESSNWAGSKSVSIESSPLVNDIFYPMQRYLSSAVSVSFYCLAHFSCLNYVQ